MKIFDISLSKTGTKSITEALKTLGFNARHDRVANAADALNGLSFDEYDAYSDSPLWKYYIELDQKYPESKFILHVRKNVCWQKFSE